MYGCKDSFLSLILTTDSGYPDYSKFSWALYTADHKCTLLVILVWALRCPATTGHHRGAHSFSTYGVSQRARGGTGRDGSVPETHIIEPTGLFLLSNNRSITSECAADRWESHSIIPRERSSETCNVDQSVVASTTHRNPILPVELSGVFFERAATR